MGASFSVNGQNTTITITVTSSTANIQTIFGIVSLYLWNDGYGDHGTPDSPIMYSSLTNQQKLDIFFNYVVRSIKSILLLDAREKSKVQNQLDIDGFGL